MSSEMEVPEGWSRAKLGEFSSIVAGQSPKSEYINVDRLGMPFLQGNAEFGSKYPSPTKWISDPLKVASKGSILFSVRAPVGEINIAATDTCIGRGLAAIRPVGCDFDFLLQSIQFSLPAIKAKAQGSTFEAINKTNLEELELLFPSFAEQSKIGAVLTSVDEAIAATEALIEQTKRVKQGLLRQLLARGIGHTRFKQTEIGEIPEGWEVAALGTVATFQPGYAFKSSEFVSHGDRLLRGSNVGVEKTDWTDEITKFFPPERRHEFEEYLLKAGDIIVAMDRPFISEGFKVVRLKEADLPALLLQRVGRFLPTKRCDPEWLWQVVSAGTLRVHLEQHQVGTDLPHISKGDIEKCQLAIPPVDEQKHIATYVTDMDRLVEVERHRLSLMTRLKSALMSDLLTGRKRVNFSSESVAA